MKTDDRQVPRLLKKIVQPLLDWYDANARILPWREQPEPYRVWLSEIMLQQTRVEAVKPYFERFLAALPTIRSLAEAPEDRLMKLWEGLGYYNRARNLQKAARMILERHNGMFPSDFEEILALPGIGEYTAGAISSIAFGRPVPAVDGNVLRVMSRLLESAEDIAQPAVKVNITHALKQIYPEQRCGDFTQSLMELGATVCLPNGKPKCRECPLAELCLARLNGKVAELPVKAPKKARKLENRTVLLLFCGNRIAIRRREEKGLLAGLYEFPNREGSLTGEPIREGAHVFAHSRRDGKEGVCYLIINNSTTETTSVELPEPAVRYTLSADSLRAPVMKLNGRPLVLSNENGLPDLSGEEQAAGTLTLAPATITFLVF